MKESRKNMLKKFIEENSFYDIDLRRDLDLESKYVMDLRLQKINRVIKERKEKDILLKKSTSCKINCLK